MQEWGSRDSIALNGHVSHKDVGERAMTIAAGFGKTVINNMQVAAPAVEKQILLRVKFAQLDRNKESQFGINLLGIPGQEPQRPPQRTITAVASERRDPTPNKPPDTPHAHNPCSSQRCAGVFAPCGTGNVRIYELPEYISAPWVGGPLRRSASADFHCHPAGADREDQGDRVSQGAG